MKDARFLNFKPSSNAAACFLASCNLAKYPDLSKALDLKVIPSVVNGDQEGLNLDTLTLGGGIIIKDDAVKQGDLQSTLCPLAKWTASVTELTSLEAKTIRAPYQLLVLYLSEQMSSFPR